MDFADVMCCGDRSDAFRAMRWVEFHLDIGSPPGVFCMHVLLFSSVPCLPCGDLSVWGGSIGLQE